MGQGCFRVELLELSFGICGFGKLFVLIYWLKWFRILFCRVFWSRSHSPSLNERWFRKQLNRKSKSWLKNMWIYSYLTNIAFCWAWSFQYHDIMTDAGLNQIASLCQKHDDSVNCSDYTLFILTYIFPLFTTGTSLARSRHSTCPASIRSRLLLPLAIYLYWSRLFILPPFISPDPSASAYADTPCCTRENG